MTRSRPNPPNPRRLALFGLAITMALLSAPPEAPAEEAVLTTAGAPLKIVVKDDTAAYAEPDTKTQSPPAKVFEFFYVLPPQKGLELKVDPEMPDEALKNGFYR